jgi:RNA recognition motif-containing protein
LPPSEGEHAGAFSASGETREEAHLAVDDVDAFPSLGMTATPLVATTPARVSARKQPAQQRALQNRLLFLNNVDQGPEVNETSFRLYFGKYTVVDVKRPLDPRTGMPHPTAFVMFASVEIRDAVLHSLKNVPMQGRKVTLEVPRTFQNGRYSLWLPQIALRCVCCAHVWH